MGGQIFLYMRAALSLAWFDNMHRKENLFDPKLLAPHVTRFDKILMLVQLVVIPLFFNLAVYFMMKRQKVLFSY
jgi:hypothetical protein